MFLHGWSMYRAGESGSVSRRSLQPMGMHKDRQGHAGGHQNCQELGTGQKKAPFGTAFPLLGRGWEGFIATTGHGREIPPNQPHLRAEWAQGLILAWPGMGWTSCTGGCKDVPLAGKSMRTCSRRQVRRGQALQVTRGGMWEGNTGTPWWIESQNTNILWTALLSFPLKTELRKF